MVKIGAPGSVGRPRPDWEIDGKSRKIKKINRFSSPAEKFRGFSSNPGAFWKQIHEWPAGPELPDRARPLRNSRAGLAGSEITPRSPNSAEAENSLKFRNFGSSKKCPRCKLSRSLIPMRPKLSSVLHFSHPNGNSQCRMTPPRPGSHDKPSV